MGTAFYEYESITFYYVLKRARAIFKHLPPPWTTQSQIGFSWDFR